MQQCSASGVIVARLGDQCTCGKLMSEIKTIYCRHLCWLSVVPPVYKALTILYLLLRTPFLEIKATRHPTTDAVTPWRLLACEKGGSG
jgi:hypothetical protein